MSTNKEDTALGILKYIAAGFGTGYSPQAPGTIGTILACGILWALAQLVPSMFNYTFTAVLMYGLFIAITFFGGLFICNKVLEKEADKDPSWIVIDEFVGLWIAMFLIPVNIQFILSAFVLFRAFDIFKPWHVGWADRELKGGMGVMMDDVLAGVYTNILLHILLWVGLLI